MGVVCLLGCSSRHRWLHHHQGRGLQRRVSPDQAQGNKDLGELGNVLPGLAEGQGNGGGIQGRLHSQGGRRCSLPSSETADVLGQYHQGCHSLFAPCANEGCDWKWGAWGEDVFTQRCMDHHYVDKVEAFDMTTDGACAADRPEGEKKNKKWNA